ncbi:MAG: AmmeMemoRadiSam system radical SAM enzyme [Thermoprotei archaeon]|nr:AmmeMemoRadiSam system radical SAM enzyme [Thermoprotei archaeon]
MLYTRLEGGRVRCNLCGRRCIIPPGGRGFCLVRENKDGKLFSLVYGKLTAFNVDPITKKPLFHVWPGAGITSISTVGCNFRCLFCDNWVLSQSQEIYGKSFTPERVVELSKRYGAMGIAYTYNEPTVFFEFMYDTARIAKENGLFNTIVTNGYMTPEAVKVLAPYLLAATVDVKGNGNLDFHRKFMSVNDVSPIYEFLLELKRHGIFIEITDLVVPEYGDKLDDLKKLVSWIIENLGPEVPFHLLRFMPDYKMIDHYVTPVETLMKHYKVAKEMGLKYVYIGNVPGHPFESTYCPECGIVLIRRYGFDIVEYNVTKDHRCPKCGAKIPIIGNYVKSNWHWFSAF